MQTLRHLFSPRKKEIKGEGKSTLRDRLVSIGKELDEERNKRQTAEDSLSAEQQGRRDAEFKFCEAEKILADARQILGQAECRFRYDLAMATNQLEYERKVRRESDEAVQKTFAEESDNPLFALVLANSLGITGIKENAKAALSVRPVAEEYAQKIKWLIAADELDEMDLVARIALSMKPERVRSFYFDVCTGYKISEAATGILKMREEGSLARTGFPMFLKFCLPEHKTVVVRLFVDEMADAINALMKVLVVSGQWNFDDHGAVSSMVSGLVPSLKRYPPVGNGWKMCTLAKEFGTTPLLVFRNDQPEHLDALGEVIIGEGVIDDLVHMKTPKVPYEVHILS